MDENARNHTMKTKRNFSSSNPRNVPKMDNSAGRTFEMVQDKQQDDRSLDGAVKDMKRLQYENDQLRALVEKLQADRDAVHGALDEVHDRLEDTNLELQNTRQELAVKCKELGSQEHKSNIQPQQSRTASEDELARIRVELQMKDELIQKAQAEFEAKLRNQEEQAQKLLSEQSLQYRREWDNGITNLKEQHERNRLTTEQEVTQRLQAEFNIQHHQAWSKREVDIQQLKQQSEGALIAERAAFQGQLTQQQSQLEEALAQIQQLQVQLRSTQQEATTQRQLQSSIDSQVDTTQMIEALQVAHAAELAECRRLIDFFRSNSERLSREARGLRSTNQKLIESVEAKEHEIEDQSAHIYAIEAQIEEYNAGVAMGAHGSRTGVEALPSVPGGWNE